MKLKFYKKHTFTCMENFPELKNCVFFAENQKKMLKMSLKEEDFLYKEEDFLIEKDFNRFQVNQFIKDEKTNIWHFVNSSGGFFFKNSQEANSWANMPRKFIKYFVEQIPNNLENTQTEVESRESDLKHYEDMKKIENELNS